MNLKISREHHNRLMENMITKSIFGSRLFGTHNENSDYDFVCVYDFEEVFGRKEEEFSHLPNIHSLQFDDKEDNTQYIWMSEKQFLRNSCSGDGTIISDIILFGELSHNPLSKEEKLLFTRTYKIIKAYCGVAKIDFILHPNCLKKRFHVLRSLYIANSLMDGDVPTTKGVQDISLDIPNISKTLIEDMITSSRDRVTKMHDSGELNHYNIEDTDDELLDILLNTNNIGEFKYK